MRANIMYELSDLEVNYYDRQKCKPKHSYSVRFEKEYLMHFIADGEGVFKVGDKEYKLKKGNAFVISKERGYYEASETNPWTYYWVNFSGEAAEKFFKIIGVSPSNPIYRTSSPEEVAVCFEELLNTDVKNRFLLLGKFFELLGIMAETSEVKNDFEVHATADEYVNECKKFIKANYYRKITMKELADYAGLEYSYLFRLFKQQTGISPGNYVINYKLSKAASFLRNNNMNVSEASLAVGYTDRVAFTRLFSKKYGMPPQTYKMKSK